MNDDIKKIARAYGVSMEGLFSKSRTNKIVMARQHAFAYLHDKYKKTPSDIARKFNLDHTTVLFGIAQFRKKKCIKFLENTLEVIDDYHEAQIPVSEKAIKDAIKYLKHEKGNIFPEVEIDRKGTVKICYKRYSKNINLEFKSC